MSGAITVCCRLGLCCHQVKHAKMLADTYKRSSTSWCKTHCVYFLSENKTSISRACTNSVKLHLEGLCLRQRERASPHLDGWLHCLALVACQRPVHQVQVQILCLQVLNGLLTGLSDTAVVRIVKLASNPHIFPSYFALLEDAGKRLAHHILVTVRRRAVYMPGMHCNGVSHRGARRTLPRSGHHQDTGKHNTCSP